MTNIILGREKYVMRLEIVLRGRGGMGVVTAGEILVKAAVLEGKYGQSIPSYGGERRGAPVTSYVRLSDEPIYIHREVYNADLIGVLDPSLFKVMNPLEGLKEDGILAINTKTPQKLWKKTFYLDAVEIAEKLNLIIAGWRLVNIPMVGAIARITGMISLDAIEEAVKEEFEGKLGETNAEAAKLGYEMVREV
ncbi:2-oxoacid:acceptor oxidoreductase family protein [Stygiolobus sp. CP850M]|uniref:2-oxoacid:acceptor oxidoreductase family protein n=1 Tax=Stygiolobus sp. CP850M TaxID=3133134 RepID=UPI00307E0F09